jgi:diguanylate cyclase (GGDEF)-like protein
MTPQPSSYAAAPRVAQPPAPDQSIGTLDRRTRSYVTGIIVAGAVAVALAFAFGDFSRPGLLAIFLVFSPLTSALKQPLPLKRGRSSVSASYVAHITSLLILGPFDATLVATASAWTQCTFRMRQKNPLHRTLFSMAGLAVTMQVAGLVYTALKSGQGTVLYGLVLPLGATTLVYFMLNTTLVALAIALSTRQPLLKVWQENFQWSAPSYLVGAATAGVFKVLYDQGTYYWWLALIVIPAYLTYRSYRLFIQRIENEQAEVKSVSAVQLATIEALALAIEAKDRTSPTQIRKMQAYAAGLARAVGMPEDEIPGLLTATLLHDVGNLAIPEHVFSKRGPLTFEEYQKIKIHPRVGAEILKNVPFSYPVASLIAAHHEHWGGNGSPGGLRGGAIPLGARILAVVDTYTALSSDRPHRPARPHHEALATMRQSAGIVLDPGLVETFIDVLPVLDFQFANAVGAWQPASEAGAPAATECSPAGGALEDIAVAHHEARALYQIAQAIGASLGVVETMNLIAASLNDLVPFACSALFLVKEGTGRFECRWASGARDQEVRQLTVASVEELERAVPVLNKGGDDPSHFRAALVAPLVFNDEVIGALAVFHTVADAYTHDHTRVFRRVADHASLVIRNSIVFERTQEESFTDPLTRLPNRRYMLLYLGQQMARAERRGSALAVVMMDLNGFKQINDTLGHQAGDRALHEVAVVLRSMVRAYDLCVRYGGDEFVAILWECDAEHAERRRAEMERAVEATYFEGRPGEACRLSVSAGVAVFPEDGRTYEELVAVADRRMYQHKAAQSARAADMRALRPVP